MILESSFSPKVLTETPKFIISLEEKTVPIATDVRLDFGFGFSTGGHGSMQEVYQAMEGANYQLTINIDDTLTSYVVPPIDDVRIKYKFYYQRPDGKFDVGWRVSHPGGFMKQIQVRKLSGVTSVPESIVIYKMP